MLSRGVDSKAMSDLASGEHACTHYVLQSAQTDGGVSMSASAGFFSHSKTAAIICIACVQMQLCPAWLGVVWVAAAMLPPVQSVAMMTSVTQTAGRMSLCCTFLVLPTHHQVARPNPPVQVLNVALKAHQPWHHLLRLTWC